jgi:hypothetical protein
MKKYICLIICTLIAKNTLLAQDQGPQHNVIQLALLLDVSGSMDGLIDQAKSELWTIVNEVAKAKKGGSNARLEIALYEYGRSSNPASNGYIVKLLDYTSDLDTISKVLFSLHTNGGEEYCGWVIKNALEELQWRDNDSIYRVIFIAGNEPFNQGSIDYKGSIESSNRKGVIINTIHCGDSISGVNGFWSEGATIGKGRYFFINHNSTAYDIATPYDSLIGVYNDSLNHTYWAYGSAGAVYKANQSEQDMNAEKMSGSVKAKRAISKTQKIYDNKKWDAVDAAKSDTTWIRTTKDEDLPTQLKGKTLHEKELALKANGRQRSAHSSKISELSRLRETYIRESKSTLVKERSLGMALVEAIHQQASAKGFVFE